MLAMVNIYMSLKLYIIYTKKNVIKINSCQTLNKQGNTFVQFNYKK